MTRNFCLEGTCPIYPPGSVTHFLQVFAQMFSSLKPSLTTLSVCVCVFVHLIMYLMLIYKILDIIRYLCIIVNTMRTKDVRRFFKTIH